MSAIRSVLSQLASDIIKMFPDINCGGCAVYAALVGRQLVNLGIETKIRVVRGWLAGGGNINDARNNIIQNNHDIKSKYSWNDYGVDFCHVIVQFDLDGETFYYDSERGVSKQSDKFGRLYEGEMTVEETEAIADEPQGWNRSFNRDDIPAIKEMVEDRFHLLTAAA